MAGPGPAGLRARPPAVTIPRVRRSLQATAVALAILMLLPALAAAHAVVVARSPARDSADNASPALVSVRFSEPVTLLAPTDMEVIDRSGNSVVAGTPRVSPRDARVIEAPLQRNLPDGTYTVRFRIVSADSHIIPEAYAWAVGPGPVAPPNLGGARNQGPSGTGGWSVSARFLELVGLGGLLGLLAFRWLIWVPAWRSRWVARIAGGDREAALAWGRDTFWVAFGVLAVGSMIAEAYLLVTYSASALGTTLLDTLRDASGIGDVLATTRLGSLLQLRGALLFALFALGAWQFLTEFGSSAQPKPAQAGGARVPSALMAGLILVVLYGISSQGHASQAPWPVLQIGADIVHIGAGSIWIAGLALVVVTLLRLPRAVPGTAGIRVSTAVLTRFSRVALVAVAAVVATGLVRSVGQLDDPAQLWQTAFGRSILFKIGLLALAGGLALRNRKVVTSVNALGAPRAAALRSVRRAAAAEFVLGLGIVLIAALLVAQVPGRV